MPKIPTFTAQTRPTTETGSVTTNIQVSPFRTVAGALRPLGKAAEDYYVKQRDNNEKLESNKKFYEMKSESQKIIDKYKNNSDEFVSVDAYKKDFGEYKKQQLSQIKNKRVKRRLNLLLDAQQAEDIYNIKKNSFSAFERESEEVYSTGQTTLANEYSIAESPEIKNQKKQQRIELAQQYENTHNLGKVWLSQTIKKIETDSLMVDVDKLIAREQYGAALKLIKQSDKSKIDSEELQKKIIKLQNGVAETSETTFHVGNLLKGVNSTIDTTFKKTSKKKVFKAFENVLFKQAENNKLSPEATFALVDQGFSRNGIVSPTYKNLIESGFNTGSTTTFNSPADIPSVLKQAVKAAEIADRTGRLNVYTTDEQERFYKNIIINKKILGMNDFQAIKAAKDFEINYESNLIKGASKQRRRTLEAIEDKFSEIKATNIGDVKSYAGKLYNIYIINGIDDNKAKDQVVEDIKKNIIVVDDYAYLKRDIEAFKSIGSVESVPTLKKYIIEQKLSEDEDVDDYYLRHNGGGQFEIRRKLDAAPVFDKDNNPMIFYPKDLTKFQTEQFESYKRKEQEKAIEKQKRIQKIRKEEAETGVGF
jgi:hypothetical protein